MQDRCVSLPESSVPAIHESEVPSKCREAISNSLNKDFEMASDQGFLWIQGDSNP